MKINKWIIIGSVLVGTFGILTIVFSFNSVIENIGISLLAGAIVSIVTAFLYYVYERQVFFSKVKTLLPQFYVNLSVITAHTGELLAQVTTAERLSMLSFDLLTSLAEENVNLLNGYPYGAFTGFRSNGKVNQNVNYFEAYLSELRNLKYCLSKVHIFALDADTLSYQLGLKQMNGQMLTQEESMLYKGKRDTVTIRTAKVHEYEASLLQKLDEVATRFFTIAEWEQIKKTMGSTVGMLLAEAHS